MKNLNPLYEGQLTKDPKKWREALKNVPKIITSKQKETLKKAKKGADEYKAAVKSGKIKEKVSSTPRRRRSSESNSGIGSFFTSIFDVK